MSLFVNSVRKGGRGESPERVPEHLNGAPVSLSKCKPRYRAAARKALREEVGRLANRQKIWKVTVTRLSFLPDWVKGKSQGLSTGEKYAWLRPKDAMRLILLDRSIGGNPTVFKAEFRHCDRCARPLIGKEAADRRELLNSDPKGRSIPCGQNCEQDRQDRFWMRLAPGCGAALNMMRKKAA